MIFSNYDGGYLNINVDVNIPNLKIGITTYEKCNVTISGTYASNITELIYAGYNGNNNHCNPFFPTTIINGAPSGTDTIILYPPTTWSNTNGWNYGIICNYSCDSSTNQGGCNTPDQIVHYYLTQFGGALYAHYTQYGCWTGTYNLSSGGNCCIGQYILPPQFALDAAFSVPNDTLCSKDSVSFYNLTLNSYPGSTGYSWNFDDGSALDTSINPVHAFPVAGTYAVTLVAENATGTATDSAQMSITIINCNTDSIYASFSLLEDTLCADEPIAFINSSVSAIAGGLVWAWNFGDGTSVDTAKNPVHVFSAPGTYDIMLIASGGSQADTFIYQINVIDCTTGVLESVSLNEFDIYPNPAHSLICLYMKQPVQSIVEVQFQNIRQQVMLEKKLTMNNHGACIEIEELPPGMYFVFVRAGEKQWVKKVVTQ